MTEATPAPSRARRIYVLWGVALTLLLALGLFCWLVVVPFLQARAAVERCQMSFSPQWEAQIQREAHHFGGLREFAERLALYLRMPKFLVPKRGRVMATHILSRCGEAGVPEAIERLRDQDDEVRRAAASTLWRLGDRRAVPALLVALWDEESEVRCLAAGALGGLKDPRAVEPLIAALEHEDLSLRVWAISSLGKIKDPRSVEPLLAALKDKEPKVRSIAASTLGEIRDPRAFEPLVSALGDGQGRVREAAARGLGELGDAGAVEPLIVALNDKNSAVRRSAARSLGELKDARAVKPLIKTLKDGNREVRKLAAWSLGLIKDSLAVGPLKAMLRAKGGEMRLIAAWALGEIGDARAVEALIPALWDNYESGWVYVRPGPSGGMSVGYEAAVALGKIGDPRAITPLRDVLKDDSRDPNRDLRQAAAEALKKIKAAQEKAVSDVLIYSSSNLSGHAVAPEWLGGDKATEQDVKLRSLKTHGEVISNPKRRNVYVNAIGHKKFVERFPSGKPLRLGRYRYAAHVQLPLSPKPEVKQKTNPQAVHTMIQFWDGRNALYKSNRATLEGAIYWDINPWTAQEFGKIKVYTHPVKLVDTGIRLRPDTSWHRFELVIDLKAQRYVSVTIDDQTRDLSNMRLARVKHSDWGRDVALTITTESLASWSKDAGAAFTWTTRFRDISFFEDRPASSDLPNQPDSGDADVR